MMEEESDIQQEPLELDTERPSIQKKLKLFIKNEELSFIPNIQYENMVNDINSMKNKIDEYKLSHSTLIQHPKHIIINDKLFQISIPVIEFILTYPNLIQTNETNILTSQFLTLLINYNGETNYSGQTPLMIATCLNNLFYVQQLIRYDIGKIDEFDKSALDYAYEFNVDPKIIDLLEQFEYGN